MYISLRQKHNPNSNLKMNKHSAAAKAAKSRIEITALNNVVKLSDGSLWRLYHAINGNFDTLIGAVRSRGFTTYDWEQDDESRVELHRHILRIHSQSIRHYYVCLGPSRTLLNEAVLRYRAMPSRGSTSLSLETKTSIGRNLNPNASQRVKGIHFFLR